MAKVTDTVRAFAEPIVNSLGLELWDVEYVREAGQWFLRVYIDKEGGVSINDCTAVSDALDPILDEKDPIPESYIFEVSSAGVERQLKRESDFLRFMGSYVSVKLYSAKNGSREHLGYLAGYENGAVTLRYKGGEEVTFSKPEVAAVHLRME